MRRGFGPQIYYTPKGEIFAFATGSDACSEHEWGSKPMQQALCVNATFTDDANLLKAVRETKDAVFPQLIDSKTINRNLDRIYFIEGVEEGGRPNAAIVYQKHEREPQPLKSYRELTLYSGDECVGAWDDESFGFKVRGDKLVAKLKTFFDGIQAGDGIFAGALLEGEPFHMAGGVMLALRSKLRPEYRQLVKAAQAKFEQSVILKAKSRLDELYALVNTAQAPAHAKLPGHLWPTWRDGPGSEVVYCVNPHNHFQKLVGYWGPYTFDALKDWCLAETKYKLVSIPRDQSVAAV